MGLFQKSSAKSGSSRRKKIQLTPIEDDLSLAAMVRFQLWGYHAGAYLLVPPREKNSSRQGRFKFVFGFDCAGIHSYQSSEALNRQFELLEQGFKDLVQNESITFHFRAFSSSTERIDELDRLIANTDSVEIKYLLLAEKKRVIDLSRKGLREPKSIRVFATYTVDQTLYSSNDWLEKVIARAYQFWYSFKGVPTQTLNTKLQELLEVSFKEGLQRWQNFLANSLQLQVRPLNELELWSQLYRRFSSRPVPDIPQLLILDEQGLREEIYSDIHPSTLLVCDNLPVVDEQWVYVNNKYVGAMTFLQKPGGWSNNIEQLRWLWNIVARDEVTDTEIVCQLTPANQTIVKTETQRLMKSSNISVSKANRKESIDVGAEKRVERMVAAQQELIEGNIAVRTAVTILVHRKRLGDLERATRYLEAFFRPPAKVVRERKYAWKLWLDTLHVGWYPHLTKPFDRRQIYHVSEALGLIPLITTRSSDRSGLELIAEDGGTPVFLDLFYQIKNLGVFGITRSGKSVLLSGIITYALALGWPVVALDFPKDDGTSTFSDYTIFMGSDRGAYFDISKESSNLFEIPNLRNLSPKTRKERLEDYKDFLRATLMTMTTAGGSNAALHSIISQIYTQILDKFFNDSSIWQRYESAIETGPGTPEWQNIPTLKDFLNFCVPENVRLRKVTGDAARALQQIQLALNAWIHSRVGKAISEPSTFRTDAQLLVFALRNLSNDADAAVLSLAAYAAAKRRTLEHPKSLFMIDEGSILFQYPDIAHMIGRNCANGNKSGLAVVISAQDPNAIANSKAGAQILQNLHAKLIGRIASNAVKYFKEYFSYTDEIIAGNATEAFFPKKEGIYSRWLLDLQGRQTVCRYYPSFECLAIVANNPLEQKARQWFFQHRYPHDKFLANSAFALLLIACIQKEKTVWPIPEDEQLPERLAA